MEGHGSPNRIVSAETSQLVLFSHLIRGAGVGPIEVLGWGGTMGRMENDMVGMWEG